MHLHKRNDSEERDNKKNKIEYGLYIFRVLIYIRNLGCGTDCTATAAATARPLTINIDDLLRWQEYAVALKH